LFHETNMPIAVIEIPPTGWSASGPWGARHFAHTANLPLQQLPLL